MSSKNVKVRNATVCQGNGINFKSILERMVYNTFQQEGIRLQYEPNTFTLWGGFKPITPFYDRETPKQKIKRDPDKKDTVKLVLKNAGVVGIRYTPDFYFRYNNVDIYIEAKGEENDVFYIKKKLFRKYLDDKLTITGQKSMYFIVYSKKQCLQAINIIRDECTSTT